MKKGFVLVETMVVSLFVVVSLVLLYKSFSAVMVKAKARNYYDNITDIYKLKTLLSDVKTDTITNNSGLLEITSTSAYVNDLFPLMKKTLFTENAMLYLLNDSSVPITTNSLSTYIKTLESSSKKYYIIEYKKDNKYYYASLEATK
ncbi:MAG: hypothetical protein RR228_00725 [Bacilli bacterium]